MSNADVFIAHTPSADHPARVHRSLAQRSQPRSSRRTAATPVAPLSPDALQAILSDLPVMIAIFGSDGQIRAANLVWERTLGWRHDELASLPTDIFQLCFPDPKEVQRARAFVTEAQASWADFAPRARDGQLLQTTWTNVRLADGSILSMGHLMAGVDDARLGTTVKDMQAQIHNLSREIVRAQEAERHMIARELHDQIGQELTSIHMMLTRLKFELPIASHPLLHAIDTAVRTLIDRVSMLSLDLRPALLDEFGLVPALRWYRERVQRQFGMAIDLTIDGLDEPMAPDVALTAYRIVQEGVTNVARHADARQAHVRIWREASTLHIQISDHGRGFDAMATLATSASGGFLGMRERTAALGGSLHIESTPGNGTTITATLPLARPAT